MLRNKDAMWDARYDEYINDGFSPNEAAQMTNDDFLDVAAEDFDEYEGDE